METDEFKKEAKHARLAISFRVFMVELQSWTKSLKAIHNTIKKNV